MAKAETGRIKLIIWAVDAFEGVDKIQRNVIQTIRALQKSVGKSARVEPVYVIPPDYAASIETYFPKAALQKRARDAIAKKCKSAKLPGLQSATVLMEPRFTVTGAASVLVDYAAASKADLIVAGTHARHGLTRLFLGSFAEALVSHSSVPVITVGARMQKERTITEIIFPTDFDDESRQVFPAVVNFARMCGAKIRILHCIFRPVTLLPGDRLASAQNTYVKAQKRAALKQIDEFMAAAHSAGVKSRGEVIASEQPVSDVVARIAKKRAVSLIAMAARSGALSTAVAGSITRNVIRSAQVPVWVLRAGAVTAKAREPRAAA